MIRTDWDWVFFPPLKWWTSVVHTQSQWELDATDQPRTLQTLPVQIRRRRNGVNGSDLRSHSWVPPFARVQRVRARPSAEGGLAALKPRHFLQHCWNAAPEQMTDHRWAGESAGGFGGFGSWTGASLLHWASLIIHQQTVHLKQQHWTAASGVQEPFCEDAEDGERKKSHFKEREKRLKLQRRDGDTSCDKFQRPVGVTVSPSGKSQRFHLFLKKIF